MNCNAVDYTLTMPSWDDLHTEILKMNKELTFALKLKYREEANFSGLCSIMSPVKTPVSLNGL